VASSSFLGANQNNNITPNNSTNNTKTSTARRTVSISSLKNCPSQNIQNEDEYDDYDQFHDEPCYSSFRTVPIINYSTPPLPTSNSLRTGKKVTTTKSKTPSSGHVNKSASSLSSQQRRFQQPMMESVAERSSLCGGLVDFIVEPSQMPRSFHSSNSLCEIMSANGTGKKVRHQVVKRKMTKSNKNNDKFEFFLALNRKCDSLLQFML
jgi:hypothetical protein